MAANGCLPSLARVNLTDLIPSEGLPSDSYKLSVSSLSQSLLQYSAAIVQFSPSDAALLRSGLDSARLYFHQSSAFPPLPSPPAADVEWCKTSGYHVDPQMWLESYDYRPGLSPSPTDHPPNPLEFSPVALPEIFALLGKAARDILDAIAFFLNLRSSPFAQILDSVPLRNREVSSSVLSVCCHARPSSHFPPQDDIFPPHHPHDHDHDHDHDHQLEKSLISIVKSDKAGLHVRDAHGRWVLVDADLGPQEALVYPGLALYWATAGYVSPALLRTEIDSNMYGRCSLAFKLMPKSMTTLSCSEMRAAGYGVEAQFQLPIPVDDFMQRSLPADHLINRQTFQSFNFPTPLEGSMKPLMRRRKNNLRCKPLPPSKRLRLEAQRVLKERVQDIADKKGIKLRFCNLKECENHIHALDSPCASIRMEIGWPAGVPFVHPHDLPNKAKIGFLEAYEPGVTHDMESSLNESGQGSQHSTNCNDSF